MSDRGPRGALGVVLAGGASRRYGAPKALATVAGERIADRAIRAVREAAGRAVLVANDAPTFGVLGLPMRPDARPGAGALGGIHTAVVWAQEESCAGALVVACDMPFLSTGLLAELGRFASPEDEAVVPASDSKRGLEPLCAYYGVGCRPAIERALDRGDRAIISFFPEVRVRTLPAETVARFGDPARLFYNVNTREDRELAERWAREEAPR